MACVRTLGTRGHLSAPRAGGWPASSCLGDQRLPPTPETGTKEELWGWFGTTTIQVPTQALSCACCSLCTRTHTFVHAHTCPQVHTFIHARAHVCSCVHTQTPKQPCDHPLCAPGSPLGGHQAEPCAVPASGASGGPPSSRALSQCMVVFGGLCGDRWGPGFVQLVPGVVDVAPPPRAGAQGEGARQRGLRRREGRAACAEAPLAAGTEASSRSPR